MITLLILYLVINLIIVLYLRYQGANSGYAEMLLKNKNEST